MPFSVARDLDLASQLCIYRVQAGRAEQYVVDNARLETETTHIMHCAERTGAVVIGYLSDHAMEY